MATARLGQRGRWPSGRSAREGCWRRWLVSPSDGWGRSAIGARPLPWLRARDAICAGHWVSAANEGRRIAIGAHTRYGAGWAAASMAEGRHEQSPSG
jgi:hypothetical protein